MNDFVELRQVLAIIRRRWWLVLLFSLIAAGIGYGYSQTQERVYQATTSVIIGQSIEATRLDSRDIQTSERLALTYADIAKRQPVLEAVVESLGLGYSWQSLRERVSVNLVPDTQLLEISVEAGSPDQATAIADELAQQLIMLSPASLQNRVEDDTRLFVQHRIENLQIKIEDSQERLDELALLLVGASTLEEEAQIQAEINALEGLIVEWETTYARFLDLVGNEGSANYIAVVDEANAEPSPIRPAIRLNTIIAGFIGAVLAVGVIFLLEFLDDTVRSLDDIGQDLHLTPLGTIGEISDWDLRGKMIVSKNPFSPVSESYRMIRSNIQFVLIDKPAGSILVTSAEPGDGKTATAVNLAIAMAHNGQRTVLVDTDLRSSTIHKLFQISKGEGLTDQLRQPECAIDVHLRDTEIDGLRLLTSGEKPPNPSELLGSQRMGQMISSLEFQADVVIFDSPPATYVADAAVLSKQVDGVVLVIAFGKTRRDAARQAVLNLQKADANILGVVLNRVPDKGGDYYYRHNSPAGEPLYAGNRVISGLRRVRANMALIVPWKKRSVRKDLDSTFNLETAKESPSHSG